MIPDYFPKDEYKQFKCDNNLNMKYKKTDSLSLTANT